MESLQSITLKGVEGVETIQYILSQLREKMPDSFAGKRLLAARDYKAGTIDHKNQRNFINRCHI